MYLTSASIMPIRYLISIIVVLIFTLPLISMAARNADKTIGWPGTALDGRKCSGGPQGFGPFDYNDKTYSVAGLYTRHGSKTESPLRFVEKAHFTHEVERLIRGRSSSVPSDIDYTLRAFPNHSRALWSMIEYQLKNNPKKKFTRQTLSLPISHTLRYPVPPPECYLNRAEAFDSGDATVQIIYGVYLHKRRQHVDALGRYLKGEKLDPLNVELLYNIGLLYTDLGEFNKAKEYADKVYAENYPFTALRERLQKSLKEKDFKSDK